VGQSDVVGTSRASCPEVVINTAEVSVLLGGSAKLTTIELRLTGNRMGLAVQTNLSYSGSATTVSRTDGETPLEKPATGQATSTIAMASAVLPGAFLFIIVSSVCSDLEIQFSHIVPYLTQVLRMLHIGTER
jgi:hypothetical protein